MSQHRVLNYGDVLPASFLAALQQYASTMSTANLVLTQTSSTAIKAPAGSGSGGNDQGGIGIMGRWRYNTADATASHPGGSAGTYDVFVTGSDNSFANTPTPDTDNTVYSFGLVILAQGSTPGTVLYRKVGEVEWDGAKITLVRALVGPGRKTEPGYFVAPIAGVVAAHVRGAASQTANLQQWEANDGSVLASVDATGNLVLTVNATLASGSVITWGGDTNIYRSGANSLKTDDDLIVAAAFKHLGSTLGFYNVTPVSRPAAYTLTSHSAQRTLNETSGTLSDVKHVLGTAIADLQSVGLLQ